MSGEHVEYMDQDNEKNVFDEFKRDLIDIGH